MARDSSDVKARQEPMWSQLLSWCDGHPRMAWWLVLISHINLVLGVAGVYGAFFH